MSWEKINEMFPHGGTMTNDGYKTIDDIILENPKFLQLDLMKPSRETIEYEEIMIWHENGNMDRYFTYSVFPYNNIDNTPLFNFYGQKVYNDFLRDKDDSNARYYYSKL